MSQTQHIQQIVTNIQQQNSKCQMCVTHFSGRLFWLIYINVINFIYNNKNLYTQHNIIPFRQKLSQRLAHIVLSVFISENLTFLETRFATANLLTDEDISLQLHWIF